jgi:hypothetical protein
MLPTIDALGGWQKQDGYYSLPLENGYEVCLEPLIFDEQWYLAVYKNMELVAPKVVVKVGK